MAIESIASVKGHFESGDRPTQAEFEDLIDTLGRVTPLAIASAAEGGKTGVYEILGNGDVTARSTGSLGLQILSVASTASAHNALGISSVQALFLSAETTASSRNLLGAGTVGDLVFQSETTASALSEIGIVTANSSAAGLVVFATRAEVSAQTSGKAVDGATLAGHPGIARAWANFDAAGSVRASFNVSAVSDDSTAEKTVTWIKPFADTNYVVLAQQIQTSAASFNPNVAIRTRTVSAVTFYHSSEVNTDGFMVVAFGLQ